MPWLAVTPPAAQDSLHHSICGSVVLTPNLLQQAMLLCVERAGAAGEEEHIQWHSWIQECTSVQNSPSLRSLLRLSLGQLLCRTNSWTSARGRAFLGIFQPSPSPLAFTVPSSRDLKPPKSPFYFLSFSMQSSPCELLSQAACPRFPIHFQSGRSRVRKVFQRVTHHMSACFGPLHWILTLE